MNLLRSLSALTTLLFVLGCSGVPEAQGRYDDAGSGSIAYIGQDRNIWVADPSSGNRSRLTEDAGQGSGYFHPTWNPDGQAVAFVGQDGTIHLADADGKHIIKLTAPTGVAPFYLYWNPSGQWLSSLGPSTTPGRGLDLRLTRADRDDAGTPQEDDTALVGSGQPYYWVWSPDGTAMLTHTGGATRINPDGARISLLDEEMGMATLPVFPGFFQAPDVAPDGSAYVVVAGEPVGDGTRVAVAVGYGLKETPVADAADENLLLVSPRGRVTGSLVSIQGIATFDWSPTEKRLAYVDGIVAPSGGVIGPLRLIDLNDTEDPQIRETDTGPVLAYFWAPDGRHIAAFRPRITGSATPSLSLEVLVLDTITARSRQIGVIQPTAHFLRTIVPFYDQYQRSATIWSPDSSQIVVNAQTPEGRAGIYTLTVGGEKNLVDLGWHPFWSPK